jgi:ABC-2 type transport system ATP-binding protein
VPRGERRARIEELLRHVGLWERRTDLVETYSKGMRQKLAFARALLHRPALVFMDEPTAGLDVQSAVALREDILALVHEAGTTVFLTTHNLAEVEKVCNQVAVIGKGRLIAVDTPARLRAGTQQPRVRILCHEISPQDIDTLRQLPQVASITQNYQTLEVVLRSGENVAPVVRALSEQGVEIEEVAPVMASLEQAFLTMLREAEEEGKD